MSIPVAVQDILTRLDDFGCGYLLTTTEGRVKVVSVAPTPDGGGLRATAPGKGTLANLAANPAVTLVFPPLEQSGHSLLIDGTATVEGDDALVVPTSAVLHRPAS